VEAKVGNLEDKIPCFILVGGKSSRFKSDKSYLFYKMQYKKCKKIFKEVYFVAKKKKFKKYPFFIEKSKIYAPIFALEEIIRKRKKVFVLSVDTPLVSKKSIKKLLNKKAVSSKNPLIGYYDYLMLKNFNKNLRIFGINKRRVKIKEKELININRQEDLKMLNHKSSSISSA
jgi:molybdopterin-guanine dinucleotide biosynthesis protein A